MHISAGSGFWLRIAAPALVATFAMAAQAQTPEELELLRQGKTQRATTVPPGAAAPPPQQFRPPPASPPPALGQPAIALPQGQPYRQAAPQQQFRPPQQRPEPGYRQRGGFFPPDQQSGFFPPPAYEPPPYYEPQPRYAEPPPYRPRTRYSRYTRAETCQTDAGDCELPAPAYVNKSCRCFFPEYGRVRGVTVP